MNRSPGVERRDPSWPTARWVAAGLALAAIGVLLTTLLALVLRGDGGGSAAAEGLDSGSMDHLRGDSPVLAEVLSVTDAVPWGDEWIILDGRSSRWHRVDAEGRLVLSAGRQGRGPGEMERPSSLAILGDTVVVAERTLGTLELFLTDGTPLGRRRLPGGACVAGWVRRMVAVDGALHVLRECVDGATGGSRLRVDRLDWTHEGEPVAPVSLASRTWLDVTGTTPFRPGRPVLAGGEGMLLFGDAADGCIQVLLGGREGEQEVCHPDPPLVPLPEDERSALLATERALEGLGARIEAPSHRVPFDEIFILPGPRLVFRTLLQRDQRRLDAVGLDGSHMPLLMEATPQSRVGSRSILLAGEAMDGTWIRVIPLP